MIFLWPVSERLVGCKVAETLFGGGAKARSGLHPRRRLQRWSESTANIDFRPAESRAPARTRKDLTMEGEPATTSLRPYGVAIHANQGFKWRSKEALNYNAGQLDGQAAKCCDCPEWNHRRTGRWNAPRRYVQNRDQKWTDMKCDGGKFSNGGRVGRVAGPADAARFPAVRKPQRRRLATLHFYISLDRNVKTGAVRVSNQRTKKSDIQGAV